MASTHKSLRSGTANKRPTTSIADGQIALNTNTTSPGLFFKDSTGATIIKVGPVHVGTTAPNASPAAGGSSGNSTGEVWLDTSLTPNGVKIWNGASWTNATPIGSTTVQGLLELATNAETQTGTDPDRAVTPAGLQSKVSDSTSTTSSTTIASSTAVKSAYDLANAALPKSGGTVTGNLEIGTTGSLSFEGATADAFETTIAVVDPTADRTITLPDTTGTVVTTGDTGTVTSTMIADGTIVDGDISATAEIAVSKLADGTARQLLQTDAAGTGVEWASNIDIPGTLDVTSTATFDSIASYPLGSAAAPTLTFTGDTNTGIYSPGADQVAISTNGSGRLFVDASGRVGAGTSAPQGSLHVHDSGSTISRIRLTNSTTTDATGKGLLIAQNGLDLNITNNEAGFTAFATSGSERLRITSAGLVGVGTSSPGAGLHISTTGQTTSALDTSSNLNLIVSDTGTSAGNGGSVVFGFNTGAGKFAAIKGQVITGAGNSIGDLAFSTRNATGDSTLTERLRITYDGKVGIGNTPEHPLDVSGTIRVKGTTDATLFIDSASGSKGFVYWRERTVADRGILGFANGSGDLVYRSNAYDFSSGTERLRITSGGNVGIGTTSPNDILHLEGNIRLTGTDRFIQAVSTDLNLNATAGQNIKLCINGLAGEAARIDSSKRLLVGTSSGSGNNLLQIQGEVGSSAGIGGIVLRRGLAPSLLGSGSIMGRIDFGPNDGGIGASIVGEGDAQQGTNDYPSRLVFSTTADGASSPTERMRISNGGYASFNTTSVIGSSRVSIAQDFNAGNGLGIKNTGAQGGGQYFALFYNSSDTLAGSISHNGSTSVAFNTSSDYRLKENIAPVVDGITRLQQLKPCRFNFIADPDKTVDGFIAHEIQAVIPEAITGEKDAVDEDGNPIYQGIDQSKLVPLLTAALQEAVAKIESLEARLTAAGI